MQIAPDSPVLAFARGHDIDITRGQGGEGSIPTTVKQVRIIGPLVRLELQQPGDDRLIEVELTRERYSRDRFVSSDAIFLRPGNLRVFADHSSTRN